MLHYVSIYNIALGILLNTGKFTPKGNNKCQNAEDRNFHWVFSSLSGHWDTFSLQVEFGLDFKGYSQYIDSSTDQKTSRYHEWGKLEIGAKMLRRSRVDIINIAFFNVGSLGSRGVMTHEFCHEEMNPESWKGWKSNSRVVYFCCNPILYHHSCYMSFTLRDWDRFQAKNPNTSIRISEPQTKRWRPRKGLASWCANVYR